MKKFNRLFIIFFIISSLFMTDDVEAMKRKKNSSSTSDSEQGPAKRRKSAKRRKTEKDVKDAKQSDNDSDSGDDGDDMGDSNKKETGVCSFDQACTCEDKPEPGFFSTLGNKLGLGGGDDSDENRDARLRICLQQNNPKILAGHGQEHELHCGYYALAHAWCRLARQPICGNEARIWLHDKLRNAEELGVWEMMVRQRRCALDDGWNAQVYPESINNLTSTDLEAIVCCELKNAVREQFKALLNDKQAMVLAQAARNNFDMSDQKTQENINGVLSVIPRNRHVPIRTYLEGHPLSNLIIIDSLTQARDIYFGQALTPMIAGCIDRYRNQRTSQAVVINIGADRGDHHAVAHWVSWDIDEKSLHTICDSLYKKSTLSTRHEQCCVLLGKLYMEETNARLNAKAQVIRRLQTAMTYYLKSIKGSAEYCDNLQSFLESLVHHITEQNPGLEASMAKEVKKANKKGKRGKKAAGDIEEIVTRLSQDYPVAAIAVTDPKDLRRQSRVWDSTELLKRATDLFKEAVGFAGGNGLNPEDLTEIIKFLTDTYKNPYPELSELCSGKKSGSSGSSSSSSKSKSKDKRKKPASKKKQDDFEEESDGEDEESDEEYQEEEARPKKKRKKSSPKQDEEEEEEEAENQGEDGAAQKDCCIQ